VRRFSLTLALALAGVAWTVWWGSPATAQDAARLAIVSPRPDATIEPDVRVVVRLVGGSRQVPFSLLVDGGHTPVEASQGSDTPVVSPGQDAVIFLPDMAEGRHEAQAVPLSSGLAEASAPVSFVVDAGGLSIQAILIAAAIIGLLVLYRRRILTPWADRYEQRPRPEEPEA
jgi:hypothetical protein